MDIPEKYRPIVDRLARATADHKLTWKETPSSDGCYVALGDTTVLLSIGDLYGMVNQVELSVAGDDGNVIGGFVTSRSDGDFAAVRKLAELARSNARQIDDRLAKIVRELDRKLQGV